MFKTYRINEQDNFDIHRYPEVESEIGFVSRHLKELQTDHKTEIVISFLKDHCISTAWLESNEGVVKIITSGFLNTRQTEALFSACKHHSRFLADFEHYISLTLLNKPH